MPFHLALVWSFPLMTGFHCLHLHILWFFNRCLHIFYYITEEDSSLNFHVFDKRISSHNLCKILILRKLIGEWEQNRHLPFVPSFFFYYHSSCHWSCSHSRETRYPEYFYIWNHHTNLFLRNGRFKGLPLLRTRGLVWAFTSFVIFGAEILYSDRSSS